MNWEIKRRRVSFLKARLSYGREDTNWEATRIRMLSAESPLLSPSNTQNSPWVQDWEKSFKIHGFPLPPPVGVAVVSSSTAQPFADSKAPPISAISRKLPGLPYLNSNAKYLYQLGLAAVNELPLPSPLFTNGKSPQRAVLSPRLSLFDLASGVFFGSTWTGNSLTLINLREAQGRLGTVKSASPFLLGRDNETEADSNESEPDEERQPIGTPATNQFSHLDRVSVDFRNMVLAFEYFYSWISLKNGRSSTFKRRSRASLSLQ